MPEEFAFRCTSSQPFDLFGLKEIVVSERPDLVAAEEVLVQVSHPDREAEGSCRWCGDRLDATYRVTLKSR